MAGGSTIPANKPNGVLTVFYGDGTSCQEFIMDKQDYAEALKSTEKAKFALSAQSGTVFDMRDSLKTCKNGCYRGYE
jgi:hypothetical protein